MTKFHTRSLLIAAYAGHPPAEVEQALIDAVATMEPDELATEAEALAADRAALKVLDTFAKNAAAHVRDRMTVVLGPGEVAQATNTGRVAVRRNVPVGNRTINEAGILEHAAQLPPDLRPVQVWTYPTISAIDKAVKAGRITRSLAAEIITLPPKAPGITWTTIGSEDE